MSLSGSLSGRVGALGAAAAALLSRAGRALPAPAAGSAGADLEELLLATPAERALSMAQTAALVERITMEADLRNALVAGDLVLRYHPIVDLDSGQTIAFEALCRWRHWSKGLLGPAQFMPLAEESGLMVGVGGWVLEESTRRLAQWRTRLADTGAVHVTVNLSEAELRDARLVDRAARALDSSGLPAERLVVEVTEAAAYAEPEEPVVRNLSGLGDLGIGLAIDDVGAPRRGRASGAPEFGSWLWQRPIRLVKIDRGVTALLGNAVNDDGDGDGAAFLLHAGRLLTAALSEARRRDVPVVAQGNRDGGAAGAARAVGLPGRPGLPLRPAHGPGRRRGLPPPGAPGFPAACVLTPASISRSSNISVRPIPTSARTPSRP